MTTVTPIAPRTTRIGPRLVPPRPPPAAGPLGVGALVRASRTNAIGMWPAAAYEEPVLVRPFFGRHSILVSDPDAVRRVLLDNARNYGRTPSSTRILRPMVGAGLFFADGQEWTRQRRATTAGLGPRALDRYAPAILDVLDRRLDGLLGGGGTVDVLSLTQRLALDVAGEALLGFDMERHGAEIRALIDRYTRRAGKPDFLDYFVPVGLPTLRDPERWLIGWRWRRLLGRMIAERRGRPPAEPDLFDALSAGRADAADPPDLREEVATMLLAGHETTALAMFWAVYVLALAPELQDGLIEEAAAFRPDDPTAASVAGTLPRTRALVEEVLRLYPPAYLIVRVAEGPDELAGVAVRRRDVILISPWVLHRHRRLWSDPEAFDPERFLRPEARPRFAYLPFGGGPRICVGAAFALLEATLFVARLLDRFDLTTAEAAPVIPTGIVTLQPDRRARFRFTPRVR